jgi:hypothetical protein
MKITKTQLRKMIKEELLKEAEGWFPNEARYPRELLSNVSKAIDWDVGQAFAFVVALLEDVNAHAEAKQVNDLLSRRQEEPEEEENYTPEDNNPEDDSNWVGHKSHY